MKRADAQVMRITLKQSSRKFSPSVDDAGKGFMVDALPTDEKPLPLSGLDNMRTSARLLDGELIIMSTPKKGTKVVVGVHLSTSS